MHLNFIDTSFKITRSSNLGLKTKVTGIWAAHYLQKTCVISYPSDDSTTGVLYRPTKSLEKNLWKLVPFQKQRTPQIYHCFWSATHRLSSSKQCLIGVKRRFLWINDSQQSKGILMILTHKIDIDKNFNFYQGQGRRVKGQCQIGIF